MTRFSENEIEIKFNKLNNKNIAVIGDIMLDIYYWGDTKRISPEAPVPVVDINKEEYKPGGAANVALNITTLNANCEMFGVVGKDDEAEKIYADFKKAGIGTDGIIKADDRPTTSKSRVLAAGQHVVRFDKEYRKNIRPEDEERIIEALEKKADKLDAIILEDYNKGLLTSSLIRKVITIARKYDIITGVDPKLNNIESYKGVTLFKPNLRETEEILNCKIETDAELEKAGHKLLDFLEAEYVLITLSERGMALFQKDKEFEIIPAKATKIANVSGAGDTVIAALISSLACDFNFRESSILANYAASVVVEDVSIVPVKKDELLKRLSDENIIDQS